MTAIRSMETARTVDMTKPAFRGRRAIVAAAAVVACGPLAAPLQAEHEPFDVTVTVTASVDNDGPVDVRGMVKLEMSMTGEPDGLFDDPSQQAGFAWRWRGKSGNWIQWESTPSSSDSDTLWISDFSNAVGPYYFQVRAWNARKVDGGVHVFLSDMTGDGPVSHP